MLSSSRQGFRASVASSSLLSRPSPSAASFSQCIRSIHSITSFGSHKLSNQVSHSSHLSSSLSPPHICSSSSPFSTSTSTTADPSELNKFGRMADEWWSPHGKFRPLHLMNPVRLSYARRALVSAFGKDRTLAQPLEGLKILDIGCGGGLVTEPLARMGATVLGADACDTNIIVAKAHSKRDPIVSQNASFVCTTAEELLATKGGGQFDAVVALEIIEHVSDVRLFISTISQLVKPGGVVLVSTLNRTARSFVSAIVGAEYLLKWLPAGTHEWNRFLTPDEIYTLLQDTGKLQVQETVGISFHPLKNDFYLSADLGINYMVYARRPLE